MSLQSLISGAECATSSNPLNQVLKHADSDRSLQRDRLIANASSSLYHLPPSSSRAAAEADLVAARRFFETQRGSPALQGPGFAPADLERMQMSPVSGPMQAAWAERAAEASRSQSPESAHWAAEFAQHSFAAPIQQHAPAPLAQMQAAQYAPMAPGMHYAGYSMGQSPMMWNQVGTIHGKGKGRMADVDFEAAFARLHVSPSAESAKIEEVHDDGGTTVLEEVSPQGEDYMSEFQKVWEQMRSSDMPPPQEDMAKWEAEFNQLNSAQQDDLYETDLQDAYRKVADVVQFDDDGIPLLEPYKFDQDNMYMNAPPGISHLQAAKDLLARNGSLSEAALMLEAAIQQGDLGTGNYEAWILLGETRSMDEREDGAMKALAEGTRLAQQAGAAGDGLISLAISYTNESFERASHTILLRWLAARYSDVVIPPATNTSPWASHDRATEAFLSVAREQHERGTEVDPDLQIGLGVLFYANGSYDRAQDCFETALSARPTDYLLWNRLGSCLSNGSKPEEALGAYRHALQLRPSYVRAIYNVGVACLNIGAHEEAAKHFLDALSMQDSTTGEKSQQIWTTLERAFVYMNRRDLAERAREGASVESFKNQGFDF